MEGSGQGGERVACYGAGLLSSSALRPVALHLGVSGFEDLQSRDAGAAGSAELHVCPAERKH